MATLITVFSCDDCGRVVGLKTDADWQRFDQNWADSLRHQFCPDCKSKIPNRALLEMDAKFVETIAAGIEPEWAEVIN